MTRPPTPEERAAKLAQEWYEGGEACPHMKALNVHRSRSACSLCITAEIRAAVEESEDTKRLNWLLKALQRTWHLNLVCNAYTGTFLNAIRSRGFSGGEERWEEKRLGVGDRGDDGRAAIDAAREGRDG